MTIGQTQPDKFVKGQRLTAAGLNGVVDAVVAVVRRMFGPQLTRPQNVTGFTIGSMTAATSALTGHTTFDFGVLHYDFEAAEYIDSGIRYEGINVDESLVAVDGTLIKCEWIDGHWQPYWVSCEADADLTGFT